MKTKTQAEWVQVFLTENIPGAPVYTVREQVEDQHFRERGNVYVMEGTDVGTVALPSSPIKLPGQTFEIAPPPRPGQHTREVLARLLKYDDSRLETLANEKVIGFDSPAA